MKLIADDRQAQRMLADLAQEIHIDKGLPHVTELIYCLTKSYLDRFHSLPPTPGETLLFVTGVGLEKVLLKLHKQHIEGEADGIFFDTDFLDYSKLPGELKTTRISEKTVDKWLSVTGVPVKSKAGEVFDISEPWRKQILSYFHCNGATEGTLGILHLLGGYTPPFPTLKTWRVEATEEEVAANWEWMLERRDTYLWCVEQRKLPTPFEFCMDWECGYGPCRYKMVCEAKKAGGA